MSSFLKVACFSVAGIVLASVTIIVTNNGLLSHYATLALGVFCIIATFATTAALFLSDNPKIKNDVS
jgi:hypothetical protein